MRHKRHSRRPPLSTKYENFQSYNTKKQWENSFSTFHINSEWIWNRKLFMDKGEKKWRFSSSSRKKTLTSALAGVCFFLLILDNEKSFHLSFIWLCFSPPYSRHAYMLCWETITSFFLPRWKQRRKQFYFITVKQREQHRRKKITAKNSKTWFLNNAGRNERRKIADENSLTVWARRRFL